MSEPRRILLLGEAPGARNGSRTAFSGPTGRRLARLAGTSEAAFRARVAQAREALRKWAVHPEECAALDYDPPRVDSVRLVQIIRGSGLDFREGDAAKCDCGLAALLAEEARDGTG